jgi:hypothetical protein
MSASADLHDVWENRLPVGIACSHCLHRAVLEPEAIGAHEGNLRCVDTLPLLCTKCGRQSFTVHLFKERRHIKRFMAEYR